MYTVVKLALMQPYFFPYAGYFQLLMAADKFVAYDDVSFIKQGWINRNYILVNGAPHLFTIPLQDASSNKLINQVMVSGKPFNWQNKLLQTIGLSYRKAPYFKNVFPIIEKVILEANDTTISMVANASIKAVIEYLKIPVDFASTSVIYNNAQLKNEERVIDICVNEHATDYINMAGGSDLYSKENFVAYNINLRFVKAHSWTYAQFNHSFVPGLSIIDVMMFNDSPEIFHQLNNYTLA